jgi:hypothetical protein
MPVGIVIPHAHAAGILDPRQPLHAVVAVGGGVAAVDGSCLTLFFLL